MKLMLILWLVKSLLLSVVTSSNQCVNILQETTKQDPEDCTGFFMLNGNDYIQQYCPSGTKYDAALACCIVGKCAPCICNLVTEQPDIGITTCNEITSTSIGTQSTSTDISETSSSTSSSSTNNDESTTEDITTQNVLTTVTEESTSDESNENNGSNDTTDSSSSASSLSTNSDESTTEDITTLNVLTTVTEETTSDNLQSSTNTNFPPTTRPTTSTSSSTTASGNEYCHDLPSGIFIPNPNDCSRYYMCSNGYTIAMSCPNGLWFDKQQNVCNYPSNVQCNVISSLFKFIEVSIVQ